MAKPKLMTLDELYAALGMLQAPERVPKLYLSKNDPRLDWKSYKDIIAQSLEFTLPGANEVSEMDGMACERIGIPLLGFLELAGADYDIREELTHLAIQAIGMAFGTYLERIILAVPDLEHTVDELLGQLRKEILMTAMRAAHTREQEEVERKRGERK